MKYTDCTNAELAMFVKFRKITCRVSCESENSPSAPSELSQYVQDALDRLQRLEYTLALRDADTNQTFHGFLRLPPELRNIVYELSLQREHQDSPCSVSLLATSKQVNSEASHFLYGIDEFTISISGEAVLCQEMPCGTYRLFEDTEYGLSLIRRPDFTLLDWPSYLRKVRRLRLVTLDAPMHFHPERRQAFVENVVFSLCQYLGRDHILTTLIVENLCKNDYFYDVPFYPKLDLYPLRMLGNLTKLEIRGLDVDPDIEASKLDFFSEAQRELLKSVENVKLLENAYREAHRACRKALEALFKACKKSRAKHSGGRRHQFTVFRFELVGRVMGEFLLEDFRRLSWRDQGTMNLIIRQARDRRLIPWESPEQDIPISVAMFLKAHVDCEMVDASIVDWRNKHGESSSHPNLLEDRDLYAEAVSVGAILLAVATPAFAITLLVGQLISWIEGMLSG